MTAPMWFLLGIHAAAFYRSLWLLCNRPQTHFGRGLLWAFAALIPLSVYVTLGMLEAL